MSALNVAYWALVGIAAVAVWHHIHNDMKGGHRR